MKQKINNIELNGKDDGGRKLDTIREHLTVREQKSSSEEKSFIKA